MDETNKFRKENYKILLQSMRPVTYTPNGVKISSPSQRSPKVTIWASGLTGEIKEK